MLLLSAVVLPMLRPCLLLHLLEVSFLLDLMYQLYAAAHPNASSFLPAAFVPGVVAALLNVSFGSFFVFLLQLSAPTVFPPALCTCPQIGAVIFSIDLFA